MQNISTYLKDNGISPTPVRILVYRSLEKASSPRSLAELEALLETVDKSTISRTLATFKDHNLVRTFNDGSGSMKYELCRMNNREEDDIHVHFRCKICGETICLTSVRIPEIKLPTGYVQQDASYIVTGICARCS